MNGATKLAAQLQQPDDISIHAPRERGDLPVGADIRNSIAISIHAPRERGDSAVVLGNKYKIISIHAPRERGDIFHIF